MKVSNFITMIAAFLLGLSLGGLALEHSLLPASSVALSEGSSVGRSGRIVTNTFYETTTITVISCPPSSTATPDIAKVDLRSQHVLAQSSLPTTTITRTSTLHSTVTVPSIKTVYTTSSPVKALSTRTKIVYESSTTTTTVSAASSVTSAHGVAHPPTSKMESDNFDQYDYELVDENSKIELRGLADSSTASAACPTDISGDYQFPHLIIPTSIGMPDQPQGTQYTVWISPAASTLFNFDVPATYTGTCSLIFLFPYMSRLDPSAGKYTYSGQEQVIYQNGGLNFALLSGVADNSTTYNSTPAVAVDYGKVKILPGNKYTVSVFPCPAGNTITIEGSSANRTELDYFQNTGNEPIGLYLVPCV
ncbi:ubiquitin 3 binding protein But2 C-terminal domain-containing protein [Cadophora sp. MPI-SDFR-AT-0126]|nr:ubiquitin 3 binding protein But2 C-terminal domain-containing protein [Leotiomycetes sp. MPI-SDFR-AT-0126]